MKVFDWFVIGTLSVKSPVVALERALVGGG
jgi:hypothetical protein